MKRTQALENLGYSITYNIGWKDGQQCVVSVTAKKRNKLVKAENIISLYKRIVL